MCEWGGWVDHGPTLTCFFFFFFFLPLLPQSRCHQGPFLGTYANNHLVVAVVVVGGGGAAGTLWIVSFGKY